MRSQFSLCGILGSVIFISQLTLNASAIEEQNVSFATSREIENYGIDTVEKIRSTALTILSIPSDKQTLENTLRPWNQLSMQLSQDLEALNALSKLDVSISKTAYQVYDGLQSYLLEVTQNPELWQMLINCSQNISQNPELDPFQHYIAARFVQNVSNEPVYLAGNVTEERDSPATDCIVFDLKAEALDESKVSNLARKILLEDADAICIQEVDEEDANDLYQTLRRNYAHFVYVPSSSALNSSSNHREKGMLIAGKFRGDPLNIILARSHKDRDDQRGGVSGEGGVTGKWGDGKGIQWEGYVKAEAYDGKGNYLEGQVTQRDDGTGEVNVRGGHESDNK